MNLRRLTALRSSVDEKIAQLHHEIEQRHKEIGDQVDALSFRIGELHTEKAALDFLRVKQ